MTEPIETAVLLVAGVGSRLRPYTDEMPKALVNVGEKCILERALTNLLEHGVRRFVLATGYRQDAVEAFVARLGVDAAFCHNPRYEQTQNSISLLYCRRELEGKGFYKLDGDVLFQSEILDRLDARTEPLVVAVDGVRPLDAEAMKVVVDERRKIRRFGKPIAVKEAHGESIGLERVSADASAVLFSAIDRLAGKGIFDRYYEDVYSELIGTGEMEAAAVEVGDLCWTEVDDYADLEHATTLFG